ncbi:hypothetical protein AD945_08350 [Gluconobacter albidus]|uniref:Transglycosylase SLT domain-containing protein n=1 Tax=Gluconobacter albidus TaxID=318683 RepID=A0A149TJ98_9PROT|nr:hypothetical protein [Gluconobacter albidus]KXV48207.1 hypothetical protein AD945_08350 [Gluconobacter albidus]
MAFFWGDGGEALSQNELERRSQQAQALENGGANQEVHSWTQALSNVVNQLLGGWQMHDYNGMQKQNDDYNAKLAQSLTGGAGPQSSPVAEALLSQSPAQAPAAPDVGTVAASPVAQALGQNMAVDDYTNRLMKAESGGDPNAANPASSARGLYQITAPTQAGIARNHPEANLPTTGTMTPQQQKVAALLLDQDNRSALAAQGVQPTDANAYGAWFLGAPTAAKVLAAPDSAPVSALTNAGAVQANPFLKNMTVGDFRNWAAGKIGSPAAPTAQAVPAAVSSQGAEQIPQTMPAAMPRQTGPDMQQLLAAMSDPRANQQTRGIASALLQNRMQQDDEARQIQLKQADPLYQAQLQEYGARTAALQQRMNSSPQAGYSMIPPQQAQAMGLDPSKTYQVGPDGKIAQIGASGVNVTLNNGPTTSEFQKKSDDAAAERLGGYIQEGSNAPALIGQLQQLSDLSKSIGTGKGAQFMAAVGPYAQALGVNVKGLDQTQAFNAIVDRMAPSMRPVGSGSSSDTDVRMFMNSLPTLANTNGGNQIIAGTMQALQQNKVQAADIASQAQRGQISWQDAETQIRKLPNPYQQFKKAHPDLSTGGDASAPSASAPTQYRSGQRARLADGSIVTFNGTSWVKGG